VLLDHPDRIFVERGPADANAGRRPEPIKDAGTRLPPASPRVDDERVLVAALVAVEPKEWQDYFLF
jgi:hypothetical protein